MQSTYAITGLVMLLGLAGCASGLPHGKQVDYDNLPGERDTASGPGLLSGDHYDKSNGGGTLLYSDKHPDKSVFGSVRNRSAQASATASTPPASTGGQATGSQQDFQDFQQFQAYKHFRQLPADSPAKQRFHDWKEWQEYKQWQKQQAQ